MGPKNPKIFFGGVSLFVGCWDFIWRGGDGAYHEGLKGVVVGGGHGVCKKKKIKIKDRGQLNYFINYLYSIFYFSTSK